MQVAPNGRGLIGHRCLLQTFRSSVHLSSVERINCTEKQVSRAADTILGQEAVLILSHRTDKDTDLYHWVVEHEQETSFTQTSSLQNKCDTFSHRAFMTRFSKCFTVKNPVKKLRISVL